MKRLLFTLGTGLAAATVALGGSAAVASAAPAPQLCLHAQVNVNGTAQTIDKCAP